MPMLNWMGRKTVTNAVNDVAVKILREDKSLSYGTGDNVLVQGDNLVALKALLPFFAGEVKCIYIDPPYNTGAAFDHYDDKELYLIGASLKDLGKKCFAFTKLDASEIRRIKKEAFAVEEKTEK